MPVTRAAAPGDDGRLLHAYRARILQFLTQCGGQAYCSCTSVAWVPAQCPALDKLMKESTKGQVAPTDCFPIRDSSLLPPLQELHSLDKQMKEVQKAKVQKDAQLQGIKAQIGAIDRQIQDTANK